MSYYYLIQAEDRTEKELAAEEVSGISMVVLFYCNGYKSAGFFLTKKKNQNKLLWE